MRTRAALTGSLVAATLLVAPIALAPAANHPAAAAASCKKARIAGKTKCIARGQFCQHTTRAMKDYERYGFQCNKRDANGRWHLT